MVLTKSKKVILALALTLAATAIAATALLREQQALSEKLIRLHVVANSNSEADQAIKLQVRDAVLAVTEPLMEEAEDPYAALSGALPAIESAAADCLAALGVADSVTVTLGPEAYPTRVYESFSLPAGQYTSLRVTIGAGEGHNWWCVVFPSICFAATSSDLKSAAATAGFSDGEVQLITEPDTYQLKFKAMEWVEQLRAWLVG